MSTLVKVFPYHSIQIIIQVVTPVFSSPIVQIGMKSTLSAILNMPSSTRTPSVCPSFPFRFSSKYAHNQSCNVQSSSHPCRLETFS